MTTVCAVVVTHRRLDELVKSLDALSTQSRLLDQLIVVDNDADDRVRDLVAGQPIPTTYLPSRRNLGGAEPAALAASTRFLSVLRDLKRVNSHLTTIGYAVMSPIGRSHSDRLVTPPPEEVG